MAVLSVLVLRGRAQEQCRPCHAREVAAFESSPMGRSVGKPGVEINSRFHTNASGSVIQVRRRGSQLEHRIERRVISATYPVAYSVGAGLVGHSYIVRIGDYL